MQKEELRRLKRINATPKMIRMAKENRQMVTYERIYKWDCGVKRMDTLYDMFVRCQTRGPFLMVCIFFPGDIAKGELAPAYEIYCNPEGNEYITRVMRKGKEERWSGAMADNLEYVPGFMNERYWYKGMEKRVWQNREGMDTIKGFLGTQEKGIWGLVEWQRNVKRRKTEEAEKRQQALWDADMALVPEIFPSFLHWMKKEAVREHFIYYRYDRKGVDEGYCTYCGRIVPVINPRHNKAGICRRCCNPVLYKSEGMAAARVVTAEYSGQVIQRVRGGIVIRTFGQRLVYRKETYTNPEMVTREKARTLVMDDGSVRRYTYGVYKNKYERFVPDTDNFLWQRATTYEALSTELYTGNLAALRKTALRNSAADLWKMIPSSAERYLIMEKKYPVIEKLARLGMFRLAEDLLHNISTLVGLKNNDTELAKILRIDRARLGRLRAADGGITHLEWYQLEKTADTIWPDDVISDLADNNLRLAAFNFLPPPVYAHAGPVKIRNYLKKQSALAGKSMTVMKNTWADYINMAQKAKMDIKNEQIWKPKDLTAAHHAVVMLLQKGDMEKEAEELEKKWPAVNGNLPKLKKFEYADENFAVLAPENILDIVREGRTLQHCVHSCDFYFDRIGRDESYLFFLRRAAHKDIPWYTLEVEPNGNIRQKRTTGDNQDSDLQEAVEFLKKWQKVFVKRMTEEEKKLGEKADRARIEEYAKLRKEGSKIWRGRLAGQLLADVLENDFMAAGQ